MKKYFQMLAFVLAGWAGAHAAPQWTSFPGNRPLMVDPSSMPVGVAKATLTIGTLRRADGIYYGEYRISLSPYFFKHEKGTLAMAVSDASLARMTLGKVTVISGTATTSGKNGKCRRINATATPVDTNRGTLKLLFMAGDREMIFEPAYHFVDNTTSILR